ncbi:MAG: hypothetical protein IT441_00390 [Phycisphaeraceae bacterium]|nr:hypothetical protein [Phycisphaeraceae bacterium]
MLTLLAAVTSAQAQQRRPMTVVLIPTTHMDIDFTQPPAGSYKRYVECIAQGVEACEADPTARFSVQIASATAAFLEARPELADRFAELVRQGRIEVCVNWTNPHYSELSGEHLVRQIAWSRWWLHEKLGVWPAVADNGELSDVTPQLAQVMVRSGVLYYHAYKSGCPSLTAGGRDFAGNAWFVGLDGSRLLYNAQNYNMAEEFGSDRPWGWPEGEPGGQRGLRSIPTGRLLLLTEGGPGWDDAMPPLDKLCAFVGGWNADENCSKKAQYVLGTYADYFAKLRQELDGGATIPALSGHTEHGEILYARVWNLARDRAIFENTITQAQTLGVWCDWLGLEGLSQEEVEAAWRLAMESSTHNWAFTDQGQRTLEAKAGKARAASEAMRKRLSNELAHRIAPEGGTVVFNTLPHPRKEIVRIGEEYQEVELPAMGWVVLPPAKERGARELLAEDGVIENARYRVEASEEAGLTRVYDKLKGRELLSPVQDACVLTVRCSYVEAMGVERAEYFLAADAGQRMSPEKFEKTRQLLAGFDAAMTPRSVSTRMAGDAAELTVEGDTGGAPTRLVVRLGQGSDFVEIELSGQRGRAPKLTPEMRSSEAQAMLRPGPMYFATLELAAGDDALARVSVPWGSIEPPRAMPRLEPATARNASSAVAAADARMWYGVYNEAWHAPLENFFGARMVQPRWLTLWNDAPSGGGITWAQEAPYANVFRDKEKPNRFYRSLWQGSSGTGRYVWRLRGHDGDWRQGGAERLAQELNQPPLVVKVEAAGEQASTLPTALPGTMSWFDWPDDRVVFSTLERTYDGKGYLLRAYESSDKAGDLIVHLNGALKGSTWKRADLLGEPGADVPASTDDERTVPVGAFEIVTLRIDTPKP